MPGRQGRGTFGESFKLRSVKELKESQMLQSRRVNATSGVGSRETGTVEKWTFQLITPRSRLSVIALTRAAVMKRGDLSSEGVRRREEEEEEEGNEGGQESPRAIYQFHRETRELFKLQRADQPRPSLISLISCPPPPDAPTSFLRSSCRVICSTMRCGDNNYYASKGATVVNLICSFRN